jgi:NAD-dependent deacetylase
MMDDDRVERAKQWIAGSGNIVFFGGAGTSTDSGIPDFRSADGLYNESGTQVPPEVILSRDFFMERPEAFYAFYRAKLLYPDAKPNAGHKALVKLEREGRLRGIITQNIDGLHQLAGNRRVLELHGSVLRNHCMRCRAFYALDHILSSNVTVPLCDACGGMVKPDVVLYQESLDQRVLEEAVGLIERADVLIVAGTSLTVHPAAGLIRYYRGDKLVLVNKGSTPYDRYANAVIAERFAAVMPVLAGMAPDEM